MNRLWRAEGPKKHERLSGRWVRAVPLWLVSIAAAISVTGCIGCIGCQPDDDPEPVSPAIRRASEPLPRRHTTARLRFAVGSMIGPAAAYNSYENLLRHVAQNAGRSFTFVQRRSYQELNDQILGGQIDLAFICSGAFASLPQDAAVDVIGVPVVNGSATYHSFIITRSDDDATQLVHLRNKRFAFTDPLSNTGYFYPLARLGDLGVTPATFFSQTTMTGCHDRSIVAVYRKLVDAAAVDSLVYRQMVTPESRYAGKLKIIETSPEFPAPLFVAPSHVSIDLRRSFRTSLLHLHDDPTGRELLRAIGVERFVAGDPSSYGLVKAYAERARKVLTQ